jgi:hypothetical protein
LFQKLITEIKIVFRKVTFYPEYPMEISKISHKRLKLNFIAKFSGCHSWKTGCPLLAKRILAAPVVGLFIRFKECTIGNVNSTTVQQ